MSEEKVEKDSLLEFLKGYVDVLKAEFPWEVIAPCSPGVSMPGGFAFVLDTDGERIATLHTKWPPGTYNPSMPVSPRDFACARLLADTINLLASRNEEKRDG